MQAALTSEIFSDLPFVFESAPGDVSFWCVEGVGDDDLDIGLGEMYGRLALRVAKEFDLPVLVAQVIRDMITGGKFGRVEAGFLSVVACAAKAGSMN